MNTARVKLFFVNIQVFEGLLDKFFLVIGIENDKVLLRLEDSQAALDNDAVIISAGGVLPTAFLNAIGVNVETKYGTA